MRNPDQHTPTPPAWRGWMLFAAVTAVVFVLGILASSMLERRRESDFRPTSLVQVADLEPDSAIWGKNFPQEYDSWKRTAEEGSPTKYGGAKPFSHLERDPLLKKLFAGYPFSVEYNDDRGHMHAVEDVRATDRRNPAKGGKPQPGTCMTCKSSNVPGLMKQMGVREFYKTPFVEIDKKVSHPIGCADCHDPDTMSLRITRPALREAFASMGKDVDKASHQEMRTLVCAQCHVEYFFAKNDPHEKKGTYLTFPWKLGTSIEAIEKYYTDEVRHVDWTHPVSKTEMIKMQHPDYELYLTGMHASKNVSCADCHMPYKSEGGIKYTDHHIQSPLNNISNSCAVCHRTSEDEIRKQVYAIQDRQAEMMERAENALVAAHEEVGEAMKSRATDAQLKEVRELIRRAQMRWDFVDANNGMGFHSPQESARILTSAVDLAQQARIKLAGISAKKQ